MKLQNTNLKDVLNAPKERLIIIAGPTASGKTAAAISLAEAINGEIISADSMQVYKYMDIGTAKPSQEELARVRHHMISVVMPDEDFSVARYTIMAEGCIRDVISRGKVPILAGGTGFYINAVLKGTEFDETPGDTEYRAWLNKLAAANGNEFLHAWLKAIDPASYEKIHCNNVKRVVRALEYYKDTGERISDINSAQKAEQPRYNAAVIILGMERELLYRRINERVDKMMAAGLVDEVENLLKRGYSAGLTSMQGLGYKETAAYLSGGACLCDVTETIKRSTRHYAKRQLTWFKHQISGLWLDAALLQEKELNDKIFEATNCIMEA